MTPSGLPPFAMFGAAHVNALLIIAAVTILLPLIIRQFNSENLIRKVAVILGITLLLTKITEPIVRIDSWEEFPHMLPLQLCDIGGILGGIMMLNRNYRFFELTYFWGFGGTLQAILTPDLQNGYPHVDFLYYFAAHGLVIIVALYATVLFKFRPVLRSIFRVFAATVAYAGFIALINWLLDANYLYLCQKPLNPSLLDYFGPWPWYILTLFPVALFFFTLCYAPFGLADLLKKKPSVPA